MSGDGLHAHSANKAGAWHPLSEHLESVGRLSLAFAGPAPWSGEAALAGRLHDLGKYGERFQRRLLGQESGLDHWSSGAWLALTKYRAIAAALAIQGHHIGLQRGDNGSLAGLDPGKLVNHHPLGLRLSTADLERTLELACHDGLIFSSPSTRAISSWDKPTAAMLDVRLLFSCVVDADFLDTEAHY